MLVCGTLALVGCASTNENGFGGTVDETETQTGEYHYNTYNPNVPGRPDGIHTMPSEEFPGPGVPMLPNYYRW